MIIFYPHVGVVSDPTFHKVIEMFFPENLCESSQIYDRS